MNSSELTLGMFPHGTVYLIRPEDNSATRRRDLEKIKGLGFNTVVLWPPVSRWDGDPPGELAFDTIDEVMDVCAELDLKVIIELQGQDDTHGPLPQWLPFADSVLFEHDNHNINHPEACREVISFIKAVAEHFKGHPALLAYDTFNEVHFLGTDCWTLGEFVEFLKQQYDGDIRALNAKWATYYRDFDSIAKRQPKVMASRWSSVVAMRDWFRFQQHNFADRLREWAAAIREVDPGVVIMADILGCDTMDNRPAGFGTNDWLTSETSQVHGLSCYANMFGPEWWKKDAYSWAQFWRQQISAACGKQVVISELMTPNRSMFPADSSSMTDQIRLWSYQALFNSIKGLIYWAYRPFTRGMQVSGRGLTDYEGNPNDFAVQAAEVAAFSARHADLLAGASPDAAGCAILHDHNTQDMYQAIQPWDEDFYTSAHRGLFRGFWENGVSPGYLIPHDIETGVPKAVRVLAIPCNVSVSQATAEVLIAFVKRGGRLVTEGRFGLLNEDATLYPRVPGAGMSDAFGVREVNFNSNAFDSIRCGQSEMPLEDYLQELNLAEDVQTVLQTDKGKPAVVAAKIGKGLYVHCAFLLGRKVDRGVGGALEILKFIFDIVGPTLSPSIRVVEKVGLTDVSVLKDENGKPLLVGIINYNHEQTSVTLDWEKKPAAIEGADGVVVRNKGGKLVITVPPRQIAAVFL